MRAARQRDRHFARREKVLGQFFTPPDLAAWMVEVAASFLAQREAALDPACGEGVFLRPMAAQGFRRVVGVDVDEGILQAIRSSSDMGSFELWAGDALEMLDRLEGQFDLVATNPPFSAKFGRVADPWRLARFALGYGRRSEAIEALFLELAVRALRPGGMLAIVLPEGLCGSLPHRRARRWLAAHATPLAVLQLSRAFFPARCCVLIARRGAADPAAPVLLAEAETGADLARIAEDLRSGGGLRRPVAEVIEDMRPACYLPTPLRPTAFPLRPLKDLLIEMRSGRAEYGERRRFAPAGLPFLSAKTVTPFGVDPRRDGRFVAPGGPMDHPQARTQVGDLLFVRVGVGCIGRAAPVLEPDEAGIADDYLYILRLRPELQPEFLALLAQTRWFRAELARMRRGTGTVTVPQRLLRELWIPVPPLLIQERFAAAYRRLHDRYQEGQAPWEALAALIRRLEQTLGIPDESCPGVADRLLGQVRSVDRVGLDVAAGPSVGSVGG